MCLMGDGREFLNSTGTAMEITSYSNRLIMVNSGKSSSGQWLP